MDITYLLYLIYSGFTSWVVGKGCDRVLKILQAILTNQKLRETLWKIYRKLLFSKKYNKLWRQK